MSFPLSLPANSHTHYDEIESEGSQYEEEIKKVVSCCLGRSSLVRLKVEDETVLWVEEGERTEADIVNIVTSCESFH